MVYDTGFGVGEFWVSARHGLAYCELDSLGPVDWNTNSAFFMEQLVLACGNNA